MGVCRDDLFAPFDIFFNVITYNQMQIPITGLAAPLIDSIPLKRYDHQRTLPCGAHRLNSIPTYDANPSTNKLDQRAVFTFTPYLSPYRG